MAAIFVDGVCVAASFVAVIFVAAKFQPTSLWEGLERGSCGKIVSFGLLTGVEEAAAQLLQNRLVFAYCRILKNFFPSFLV